MVAKNLPVYRAMEFGAAYESTAAFVDSKTFPKLSTLIAFESCEKYTKIIKAAFDGNEKLMLIHDEDERKILTYAKLYSPVDCLLINSYRDETRKHQLEIGCQFSNVIIFNNSENQIFKDIIDSYKYRKFFVDIENSKDACILSNEINVNVWR